MGWIHEYLEMAGHSADDTGALFRPASNNASLATGQGITADAIYKIVRAYSSELGFAIGAHAYCGPRTRPMRSIIRRASPRYRRLGHANIATTRIYDHRKTRPEDSLIFKVND